MDDDMLGKHIETRPTPVALQTTLHRYVIHKCNSMFTTFSCSDRFCFPVPISIFYIQVSATSDT